MRFVCEFDCKSLPVSYHMMFTSLIKESLKKTNPDYFEEIYNYGNDKNNKKTKNFCFSIFMKNYKLSSDVFEVNNLVKFYLSSPDMDFVINLYNGLLNLGDFDYKSFKLSLKKIFLLPDEKITKGMILFKTMSPILIVDKNKHFISPYSDEFPKELNYILDLEIRNASSQGLKKEVEFQPVEMKKTIVKLEITDFKNQTGKQFMFLEAYKGSFKLTGDPDDLKSIYDLGIGFRRNQGFGMIGVV
ncbi:MAG: CRISPR-associated endoribonuclease Cas6 [Athalassotoga sp.]|uniref:CRISPR-associated endoribonuclease Cas6 n=1 Tax=Athalassotoga sp. TaxID=2022597 RepID=UPI003D0160AC